MSQFLKVFRFELGDYLRRKSYLMLTVGLVLVLFVVMSWPRISALLGNESEAEGEVSRIAIGAGNSAEAEGAAAFLEEYFGDGYTFVVHTEGQDSLEGLVRDGGFAEAIWLEGPEGYTRYVPQSDLFDAFGTQLSGAITTYWKTALLDGYDIPAEDAAFLLNGQVQPTLIAVAGSEDAEASYWITYVLIMLMYITLLMYGNFVATSVATEKSTRAMELLITSTKPRNLMFGKVIGAGCAGLLQLVIILGAAVIFYGLNASYYTAGSIVAMVMNMPLSLLFYIVLFFILGFFIYAFLFAALASLVSRTEDLSTAIQPVIWVFVAAFLVVIFSIVSPGGLQSPLMLFASFFPLTSPMAMFARVAAGGVPVWQVGVSVALLVGSCVGIGLLASAIYRIGVLLYGTRPKLATVLKMLRTS